MSNAISYLRLAVSALIAAIVLYAVIGQPVAHGPSVVPAPIVVTAAAP
jgi:hypothetical protein